MRGMRLPSLIRGRLVLAAGALLAVMGLGAIAVAATGGPPTPSAGVFPLPTVVSFHTHLDPSPLGDAYVPDGYYEMRFTIFDRPSGGGAAVWGESQRVRVRSSAFTVLLGSATPLTPAVFQDPERWLEFQVGRRPVFEPRQRFASVPYAFTADNAFTLQGLPPSAFAPAQHLHPELYPRMAQAEPAVFFLDTPFEYQELTRLSLGLPSPGLVMVNVSGTVTLNGPGTYVDLALDAGVIRGGSTEVDWAYRSGSFGEGAVGPQNFPFTISKVYTPERSEGDTFTVRLLGKELGALRGALVEVGSFYVILFPTPNAPPGVPLVTPTPPGDNPAGVESKGKAAGPEATPTPPPATATPLPPTPTPPRAATATPLPATPTPPPVATPTAVPRGASVTPEGTPPRPPLTTPTPEGEQGSDRPKPTPLPGGPRLPVEGTPSGSNR
ncbi:MAG: hypothetical protein Q8O40_12850 [Chloroflexota bacterium]|nr:hypothetical protein [Chloroflexota bacterium]